MTDARREILAHAAWQDGCHTETRDAILTSPRLDLIKVKASVAVAAIKTADGQFEQGERQALLQLRSFIARHGAKEAAAYCAQRLHDITMDRRHREKKG